VSTEILLVSRAQNPDDDERLGHASAPAVHLELVEHSWRFDLVAKGVEVASSMTSTDLARLWCRLGIYLDAVCEPPLAENTSRRPWDSLPPEPTPPQAPVLATPRLADIIEVLSKLVDELVKAGEEKFYVEDWDDHGDAVGKLLFRAKDLLEKRS
jgi:hypothetical protein